MIAAQIEARDMALRDFLRSVKNDTADAGVSQVDYSEWEEQPPLYEPVMREQRARGPRIVAHDGGFATASVDSAKQEATIVCVGDILCEEKLFKASRTRMGFDFSGVYQFVKPLIMDSDLAIANLETTICESSPYTGEQYKVGGKYHNNAPVEFLEAIRAAGFDYLMLANNHSLDSGVAGVVETLRHIDDLGLLHTGLFAPETSRSGSVVSVAGIKIGLLSYSTWYNRNQGRLTEEGRKTIINEYAPEKVRADISELRERGAEFVLVYMHWGIDAEYKSSQSPSMEVAAREVANAGADYIVGSHTHSVQPYVQIAADDGRLVPCIFSMGNFVTSERAAISRDSLLLRIRLRRIGGRVVVASEKAIPCHVPDDFLGVAYPVLPASADYPASKDVVERCESGFRKTSKVVGRLSLQEGERFVLTKTALFAFLGLPSSGEDCCFSSIRFAMDSQPKCVAVLSDITSNPLSKTSLTRKKELAAIALEKGAALLLSDEPLEGFDCVVVPDMFDAFCSVVRGVRDHFNPKTIAITGSIGKTTTTEMVRTVICSKYKDTHYNTGSANNVRYCGTVVQNLRTNHGHYVQELMEGPPFGAASTISKMVKPQAAIVTVVGTSHLEHFGSQERILESCLGIQNGMPSDGLLILNGDDPLQRVATVDLPAVYYGIDDESADYRATDISCREGKLHFNVLQNGGGSTPIVLNCFGRHNVLDALAAFAAGKWAGMTDEEIAKGLASYRPEGIRQNFIKIGGYSIFLDCYNSSKESVASSLDALSMMEKGPGGRYIAVLADVMEVGDEEEEVHREIGRIAAGSCLDILICYGERAAFIAEEARALGMPRVVTALTPDEVADAIRQNVTTDDIVMLKGSHGMALEHIADAVWGTWYHEEFERYDFKARTVRDDDFEYVVYSDHVVVKKKLSSKAAVAIPDAVEGLPVTGLADSLFNRSRYTEEVALPYGLVNIRYCSFYKADKLTRIDIPASVRVIHTSAFSTCANLKEVVIREGCTHLGCRAFGNCGNLEVVVLPKSVAQIDDEAFVNCKKLTIYGESGSVAERYAEKHGIPFKSPAALPAVATPLEIGGGSPVS